MPKEHSTKAEKGASRTRSTEVSEPHSRRAVVLVLGDANRALTLREMVRSVGQRWPTLTRSSLEQDLSLLLMEDIVKRNQDNSLELTLLGEQFYIGIRAFAEGEGA